MILHKVILGSVASLTLISSLALPGLAKNSNEDSPKPKLERPAINLTCVQTAVSTRDTAVGSGWSTYSAAISAALTARKTALNAAWSIQTTPERNAAVKAAWTAYTKSVRDARKVWREARDKAWKQFRTDRKACKAPALGEEMSGKSADNQL